MTMIGDLTMLIGALLVLIAAIGSHRFGDPLARLHAAGKASGLGALLLLAGAGLRSADAAIGVELALTGVLLVVTVPLATHVLVRSVYRRQTRANEVARQSSTS